MPDSSKSLIECKDETCPCKRKQKYNPWLLYNEKIVDFIRWKEAIVQIIIILFCIGLFGILGIFIGLAFLFLTAKLGGGAIVDFFHEIPPKTPVKTIKKTFYCKKCKEEHTIYKEVR